MRIAVIAINKKGKKLALKIKKSLPLRDNSDKSSLPGSKIYFFTKSNKGTLVDLTGKLFNKFDGMIFCMAVGIVVRVISPYIKTKYIDPAVVVVDDEARFAISLLSGHEGGANKLAIQIANILGAEPVITTASESQKNIVIGIGCKRGIKKEEIIKAVKYAVSKVRCSIGSVRCIATIDLKQNEVGLKSACRELGLPLRIVSTDMIKKFNGKYNRSAFVKEKIGVDGVCEPCALLTAIKPKLILPKQKVGMVTAAVVKEC